MGIVCRQIGQVGSVYPRKKRYNVRPINPNKIRAGFNKNLSLKPIIFINQPRATAFYNEQFNGNDRMCTSHSLPINIWGFS
ncbi:hypothetical protein Osc7112_4295 [Oscillatoria nigro-viridis PCC 7112]|uniref:Uncharacterized protein n=1 Tax=Phormidium nigroviride PCC 7112 TaxID=179408 RepID=K9VMB0_9CYAN|nr:hypothetical protein Osc7112_4295 [Oscillatoria nigro-viridis PCC 7112]